MDIQQTIVFDKLCPQCVLMYFFALDEKLKVKISKGKTAWIQLVNSLPNDKTLDCSNLTAFADDKNKCD